MTPDTDDELEQITSRLEASDRYRVLRRLSLKSCLASEGYGPTKIGMFLDIESTGLNNQTCEPIELAIVPFEYRVDGTVVAVHAALHQLNEPSNPITAEITAITGITTEMVAGHRINPDVVATFVESAAIVIAHNAAFDRPIAERISPLFREKPWACSMSDVNWIEEGFEGRRLGDLLRGYGMFFDAHRAVDDCEAGIALLTRILPRSGRRVLDALLSTARRPSWRIFAVEAPYECREELKRRGYRWNLAPSFGPRAWWIDLEGTKVDAELQVLETEIFHRPVHLPIKEITAYERYSSRDLDDRT
jgi:DNA polymerase-3 subunit epsilon